MSHDHWFELEDVEHWMPYLENEGYVVIKRVADTTEVSSAIDMYWEHYETTDNVDRNNTETWSDWYLDRRGIQTRGPTIQCGGAWFVRGLPRVKSAFANIWETEDLIVSMDSLIVWKPWWVNSKWIPITEGYHMDQNPFTKPNRLCVQGMVPLYDVDEVTGGLQVVPRSNTPDQLEGFRARYQKFRGRGDFCVLDDSDPLQEMGKLVIAEAGDLILWDSLTAHRGLVGTGEGRSPTEVQLARMSQTVCMVPRDRADNQTLKKRITGWEKGWGFTHWPNEAHITSLGSSTYSPVDLTPEQRALL
jgi:hypothetical protein